MTVEKLTTALEKIISLLQEAQIPGTLQIYEVAKEALTPSVDPVTVDNYIAYVKWYGRTEHRYLGICDSDADGAFKVYRHPDTQIETLKKALKTYADEKRWSCPLCKGWIGTVDPKHGTPETMTDCVLCVCILGPEYAKEVLKGLPV